ncbi:MAG TPA: RGCVC family protein [Aldersonia sp.]
MTSDRTFGSKTQRVSGSLRRAQALESTQSCAACPHSRASHDPIGIRFCAATSGQHLDRKCICAGEHATGQHYVRF